MSSTCPHNMVNFGLLAAEMGFALKFAGVPQTTASISAASGPEFTTLRRHVQDILLLNNFFSDC